MTITWTQAWASMVLSTHTLVPVARTPTVAMTSTSAQNGGIGSAVIGTLLSAAILAALVTATVNVVLARRKSREEERSRLRDRFAQAYGAYTEYCEFAYAIRRRRHDDPAAERVRISDELRKVQAELSTHEAWVKLESGTVGTAYTELVQQARKVAGGAMRQAWIDEPATTDADVNIPSGIVDLGPLKPFETAYMEAVEAHLRALAPWWSK
jgi:hypothetical protein